MTSSRSNPINFPSPCPELLPGLRLARELVRLARELHGTSQNIEDGLARIDLLIRLADADCG